MEFYKTVESSNLDLVHYYDGQEKLEIVFKNGLRYEYEGISKETYEDLLKAESKGKYFNLYIKKNYRYKFIGHLLSKY